MAKRIDVTPEEFRAAVESQLGSGIGAGVESLAAAALLDAGWDVQRQLRFLSPEDFNRWEEIDILARKRLRAGAVRQVDVVLHISCTSSRTHGWVFYVLDRSAKTEGSRQFARKPLPGEPNGLDDFLRGSIWSRFDDTLAESASAWRLDNQESGSDPNSRMWEKIQIAVRSTSAALWRMSPEAVYEIHLPVVLYEGHLLLAQTDTRKGEKRTASIEKAIGYRSFYDIPGRLRQELVTELHRIRERNSIPADATSRLISPWEIKPAQLVQQLEARLSALPRSFVVHVLQPYNLPDLLRLVEGSA